MDRKVSVYPRPVIIPNYTSPSDWKVVRLGNNITGYVQTADLRKRS